jgi:outer membrane protein assembly factor BamB
MRKEPCAYGVGLFVALSSLLPLRGVVAADRPQWGEQYSRNMVSAERDLPTSFDPATGQNIKWSVDLGSQAFASPVIAQGRVLIGTNNGAPQDPRHQGDHGVLLCLKEEDGSLQWQLVVPRLLGEANYLDQPGIGFCSPPTVEGDRVYVVTNRCEVVCLDLDGLADGNDGPYRDEGQHLVQPGEKPMEVGPKDADIIWLYDLIGDAGVHPHDSAHSSILMDGKFLYVNSCNGVDHQDHTRTFIPKPDAPSLVVLDKETGRLVAQDDEHIGPNIYHCTWSSPALGEVNGRRLIFFCGGDGVVFAFEPIPQDADPQQVQKLKRVWRYDCDPTAPKTNVHVYFQDHQGSPSNIMGPPVFYQDRVYVTGGGDFWWGKSEAWVQCIDATQTGDITQTGRVWSQPLLRHSCTAPAIVDDLVFVGDLGRKVHCFDAQTGQEYWSHGMKGEVWSSILAADGKVYAGSRGRDVCIFEAAREKKLLASIRLDNEIATTPVAANGVLYVNTMATLYAIRQEKPK